MQEQDSILVRSKSYDARFNDIISDGSENLIDSEPVYVGNERLLNSENSLYGQQMKRADKEEDKEEQTKIIVTSFAPIPASADSKSRAAFEPSNYLPSPSNSSEPVLSRYSFLLWPNGRSNLPLIVFNPKVVRKTCWDCRKIGETYRLTYKFFHGERKLVKAILDGHGFREVHQNSSEFNVIWSGSNLKSYTFRSLQENQKVNHFPRTCELTRKDRLYKNIQRMQKDKGQKAFSIVPTTFVLPFEIDDFYNTFYKEKGVWIVKPVSLSRGRGIFLINHPDQIPLDDNLVVSKYIANPLLIDGFKFDLRLYVAVTSFDPLVFYLYEEGLTRFATIKYDQNLRNLKNTCMHLTNYSVNKKNDKYVKCTDPDVENYGNKWSISAFIKYLNGKGVDTFSMMMNIEEAIIKTLLSVESPLASASRMFVPFRGNCFELFGFDILIDESYKPWVLEVNLSPSLDCDALIDIKIKSNMIADLLSLTGVYCQNSASFSSRSRTRDRFNPKNDNSNNRMRMRPHSANQPTAGNGPKPGGSKAATNPSSTDKPYEGLSQTEQSILKICMDEEQRANGWIRLFPCADSWEFYSQYLETRSTGYNMMLHKKIYPRRWMSGSTPKKATQSRAKMLETLYESYRSARNFSSSMTTSSTSGACLEEALERYKRYEQKLNDQVRPNEETLKKLNAVSPSVQNYFQHKHQQQQLKSSFQTFPNGTLNNQAYEDMPPNEPSIQAAPRNCKERNAKSAGSALNKQLPAINRMASAKMNNKPTSAKSLNNRNKQTDLELNDDFYDDEFDGLESCSDEESSDEKKTKDAKDLELEKTLAAKPLDLESVVKLLENSHYISRIQVRNAFALYLLKIQFRMVAESQSKDDSNLQQMELVTRFLKKAAPNLSQELNIYIPSKRLPLVEQKRMLGKQLADFLHIYRKDTEQMRISQSGQLEAEKKRNRNRQIDEAKFQSLVYNLSESQLEHLMSAYMKSVGSEASIFLGVASSSSSYGPSRSEAADTDTTLEAAFESSASSATLESSGVPIDEKKTFYDRKLKRRVISGNRINSRINSSQVRRRLVEEKLIKSRAKSFFEPQVSSVPLSRSSRSRSRSRSSVSESTRSNSRSRLNRSNSTKIKRTTLKTSGLAQKSVDYETMMRNIYLTNSGKNKVKSIKNTSSGKRNSNSSNIQTSILLPIKSEPNDYNSLQRTPFTNQLIGQKSKIDLNATRSSNDLNSDGDQQQIQLITGLKNLAIKQQERVYSASRNNLKLASSLNLANELSGLSSKEASADPVNIDQRNNLLIQRLEKQKEKTSRLLQKSKAKHTEMILSPLFQSYHFSN